MPYLSPRLIPFTNGKFHPLEFRSKYIRELVFNCVKAKITLQQVGDKHWYCPELDDVSCHYGISIFLNNAGLYYNINCALLEMSVTDPYLPSPLLVRIPRKFLYKLNYKGQSLSVTPIEVAVPMKTCNIF